jgi:DNA-binding transcriptional regulator YdaS (Cro superfamily)
VLTEKERSEILQMIGGVMKTARLLGCSHTLMSLWRTGRQPLTARKARRLQEFMLALQAPALAAGLEQEAQAAEARRAQYLTQARARFRARMGHEPDDPLWYTHKSDHRAEKLAAALGEVQVGRRANTKPTAVTGTRRPRQLPF